MLRLPNTVTDRIHEFISQLKQRRAIIDETIELLKKLHIPPSTEDAVTKRGRRVLSTEERMAVSARMTAYWAKRRKKEGLSR